MTDDVRMQEMQARQKDIHAVIARDFSASRMSTTKWRKVAECLANLNVFAAIKFVDEDKVYRLRGFFHYEGDWFDSAMPGPFAGLAVEWVNINPLQHEQRGLLMKPTSRSHAEELERRLQAARVPYYWEGDCIRIAGHVRNSQT